MIIITMNQVHVEEDKHLYKEWLDKSNHFLYAIIKNNIKLKY